MGIESNPRLHWTRSNQSRRKLARRPPWNDADMRGKWLGKETLIIRKATSPKSLRITWGDGTNLDVNLFPKGDSKSSCGVEAAKLAGPEAVEERKAYWSAALDRLKTYLE